MPTSKPSYSKSLESQPYRLQYIKIIVPLENDIVPVDFQMTESATETVQMGLSVSAIFAHLNRLPCS